MRFSLRRCDFQGVDGADGFEVGLEADAPGVVAELLGDDERSGERPAPLARVEAVLVQAAGARLLVDQRERDGRRPPGCCRVRRCDDGEQRQEEDEGQTRYA